MRRLVIRASATVAAVAAVSAFAVTEVSASGVATIQARQRPGGTAATVEATAPPGARLWIARYNGPGRAADEASKVAVSPDGSTVYVTGASAGTTSRADYATVAYRAATGRQLWVRRYNGPGNRNDVATAIAVSPDGSTVYITGYSIGTASESDFATVAYRSATGRQLWVRRYNGPGNNFDFGTALAVSPAGRTVFVTGYSGGTTSQPDYATIAYRASTGRQLWVRRYNGPGNNFDFANAIAVSPAGRAVFVTGYSVGTARQPDYATIAYAAATGRRLWVRRYNGPANGSNVATAIAVGQNGRTVFVTGYSTGTVSQLDYATIAYSAASGKRLWVQRYNGPGNAGDRANSLAMDPAGRTVFVTGTSRGTASGTDYATIAYSAATGRRLWLRRYNGPGNSGDEAESVTAAGNGMVYVTGSSAGITSGLDYATVAYNGRTGAPLWVKRYNGPGNGADVALSVTEGAGRVFVTGPSTGTASGRDYATIAYRA